MLFKELIGMLQMNFVHDTKKTAHRNVATRKYVLKNRNKYIYDFWMTVSGYLFSAGKLNMRMLAMIICQRRLQLQNIKDIILHLTKKDEICLRKKQQVVGSKKVVLAHVFCVLKFLTLPNNKSSVHK